MKALSYISLALFVILSFSLGSFVQDDSFIVYRYAQNIVDGHGAVWNQGERVEGFTSPVWLGLATLVTYLDPSLVIPVTQLLGLVSGVGIILLVAYGFKSPGATLLLGANPFLAYWSLSGMESLTFSFLLLLSVWAVDRKWLVWVLIGLTLTRPEGIFVSLILLGWVWLTRGAASQPLGTKIKGETAPASGRMPLMHRFPVTPILTYLAFLALFFGLRYWYYGSLVPNTAVAKTGFSAEYIMAGLQYTLDFARDGLLYGAVLIPLVFVKYRNLHQSTLLAVIIVCWTIYVVAVGGDVLRAGRFFLPVVSLVAILAYRGLPEKWQLPLIVLASGLILYLNNDQVRHWRDLEVGLVNKMQTYAKSLPPGTTVAASTIGMLGYANPGLTVIDLLGLTDSTIARHPRSVEGIESNWRERKYNAAYVINRHPDVVIFSTGWKPSAPAERALFCFPGFILGYQPAQLEGSDLPLYIRTAYYPAGEPTAGYWVNDFVATMNRLKPQSIDSAKFYLKQAVDKGMPKQFGLGRQLVKDLIPTELTNMYDFLNNAPDSVFKAKREGR